jgi:pimeloyl-ACP methyl ester carboxylesterase
VICLHSSASSSTQWSSLTQRLECRFRVVAPDLWGEGRTAPWPGSSAMRLDDAVDLLGPVLSQAGDRFHLVGHSFGGAVALKTALRFPDRVATLALYEPVLFSSLVRCAPTGMATREIMSVRDDTTRLVAAGMLEEAAARFVDYWVGSGSWSATPPERRSRLATAMRAVIPEWDAAFDDPVEEVDLRALRMPVLLLRGSNTTVAARAVATLLAETISDAEVVRIDDAGHMGPLTHHAQVGPLIEAFLDAHSEHDGKR